MIRKLADTYAPPSDRAPMERLTAVGPEALWKTHMQRRPKDGTPHAARVDRYLARMSQNYWLADWYPMSETLFEHLMHLVSRVALVRFLLIGHPDVHADADDAACDRAAVEVIYSTSRACDHNPDVRAAQSNTLKKRGMLTLEHAGALLKL